VTVEALTCPFCGAPYKAIIPAGTIQVKCNYCGAAILVPPRLGGVVRQCPNHPDTLAVGICNDCGQSYCTRCLYAISIEGGKLHVCAKCYEKRRGMKTVWASILLIFSIILLLAIPFIIATPRPSPDTGGVLQMLFAAILLLTLSLVGFSAGKKMPPSVYDTLQQGGYAGHTPKAFLKKCIECQKEIPIASEECPYCQAKQKGT
jgi:DNA-directed RNA polymerase subunit RPC12/RpoP